MKPRLVKFRKGKSVLATGMLALATIGGCAADATRPVAADSSVASAPLSLAKESSARGGANLAATDAASSPPSADQVANANSASIVAPTMVIRNGAASIEVDSLEIAIAAVQRLATSLGGYVGNSSLASGAYSVRSAELQLKIPSSRFEAAVGGLAPIGKVESQTSTAEDVGEEFYDVTARQANAHRLEERLVALLATRTGKLEDVLAVERELARVREEVERYEGRLRYLKSHVATSTLVVTVHEKKPVVGAYAGENVIAQSFKNAWRIFVQFIAALISSLGWVIPLGVIVAVLAVLAKRWNVFVSRNSSAGSPANKTNPPNNPNAP